MDYPKYIEINGKKYDINTDFRIAIECNAIAEDKNISDYERPLAIIYKLFGSEALRDFNNHQKLFELALKYLSCGNEIENNRDEKPDMDFVEDFDYIEASFMSDYKIDLETTEMHFWKFIKLMNGLSNSEMGNCCVLNSVRNLRNMDLSQIKDDKERQKLYEAQQRVALKRNQKQFSQEEENNIDEFNKIAGI